MTGTVLGAVVRRWLPSTSLRDLETHLAVEGERAAACGQGVMWARPGHPTTRRPRCSDCERGR
ncbi:hypothetical protein [Saccharopolyspora dendranthemae]|uniref:hypothetical protein n=1 Tax=Saccharopolyspora dendranthemae TaxID=1181886 RepID=UPI00119E01BD|nr:hypothetical protein [Saccharopolyspora dendranthemae]